MQLARIRKRVHPMNRDSKYNLLADELLMFDASFNFGEQSISNNNNALYKVEDVSKFVDFLNNSTVIGFGGKENQNALEVLNNEIDRLSSIYSEQHDMLKLLSLYASKLISHIELTSDFDISVGFRTEETGLNRVGTWLSSVSGFVSE